MGSSRKSTTPVKEVKENFSKGACLLKHAGAAAARGTRDATAPRVNVFLTKVGLKRARARKWPWVVGAIGAGLVASGAVAYLWYRQRSESLAESLLTEELLDDTEDGPQITDEAINEELINNVTRR